MKQYSFEMLKGLEVINVCNGARLGYPTNMTVEMECEFPRVTAFTVSAGKGLFCGREEITVPWCHVECIGEDSILVRLTPEQCASCCGERGRPSFWKK